VSGTERWHTSGLPAQTQNATLLRDQSSVVPADWEVLQLRCSRLGKINGAKTQGIITTRSVSEGSTEIPRKTQKHNPSLTRRVGIVANAQRQNGEAGQMRVRIFDRLRLLSQVQRFGKNGWKKHTNFRTLPVIRAGSGVECLDLKVVQDFANKSELPLSRREIDN